MQFKYYKKPHFKQFFFFVLTFRLFSLKTFSTMHRSVLSAIKIVSANSKGVNSKGLHSRWLSVEGSHFIWRLNYYQERDTDITSGIKQNQAKNCVIRCPSRKRNFKNWFIPNIKKPKMHYSLSRKGKEVVSKVNFVIFTVSKIISKNRVATHQERCML